MRRLFGFINAYYTSALRSGMLALAVGIFALSVPGVVSAAEFVVDSAIDAWTTIPETGSATTAPGTAPFARPSWNRTRSPDKMR